MNLPIQVQTSEVPSELVAAIPKVFKLTAVPDTAELKRIVSLSKRIQRFEPGYNEKITDLFSKLPRGAPGRITLWDIQSFTLVELINSRGILAVIAVGGGKTLICYLAPTMVQATRPLLLIPAALRSKTFREFAELSLQFYGPNPVHYRIESYQRLAAVGQVDLLDSYKPDLIVCDEAQHLRNPRAACTRRVKRYMEANPATRFVALSGTFTKRSIKDYSHIATWCLGEGSPLPRTWTDCEPWAQAIDEKPAEGRRILPGALKALAETPAEFLAMKSALVEERTRVCRQVFRRRFEQTPSVISSDKSTLPVGLIVQELDSTEFPLDPHDGMESHWSRFRDEWELPDGQPLVDTLEVARHARELALGFFYRWKVPAPQPWKDARKAWGKFVRSTLKKSRTLDTELQVIRAIQSGKCIDQKEGEVCLWEWHKVKPTFTPETEPFWLSDTMVRHCAKWMNQKRGIVWTEHEWFAQELSRVTSVPFYGEQGVCATGRKIEDHPRGQPLIASLRSNGTGRNLQPWFNNLITAVPFTGSQAEQLLGRTHRPGQREDTVFFDVVINCREHVKTFSRCLRDADYIQTSTGIPQKLSTATIDIPDLDDIEYRTSRRWG